MLAAEPITTVARRAVALGVEAHLVGGAVRDQLAGRESHDYDVVVSGRGRELSEAVAGETGARFVPLGGKDFASFRVVARRREGEAEPPWELDVWDREGGSLEADLARRDFTVNAIALPLAPSSEGAGVPQTVDPFGGAADLERRLLRATTAGSFTDDPLRVLRLPRLLVQLAGFTADPGTVELARDAVPGLARVAPERVRDELRLIFARDGAHRALAVMRELRVYPSLWLGEPGSGAGEAATRGAVRAVAEMERLASRADHVAVVAPSAPTVDLPAARWAISFRPLPEAALVGASSSAQAVRLVEAFRDRGHLTRERSAGVIRLLAEPAIPVAERERRRFLHRMWPLWPTSLAVLGTVVEEGETGGLDRWRAEIAELAALVAADRERILTPPRLLSGEDVQQLLGLPPGRAVGEALARVRRAQVDGEIAHRDEAEALLLGRR